MKLGRNMIIYASADLLGRSIGLIASPISTRLLTPEQYGAAPLLGAVWATIALFQYGGMDSAYPFFRSQAEDNQREIVVTSTVVATLSFGLVWLCFAGCGLIQPWLQTYAKVSQLELIFFLLGLVPGSLIGWYLYLLRFMHQAMPFVRINLLGRVLGVLIALPIVYFTPSQWRLLVIFAVGATLQLVGLAWAFWEFRQLKIQLYRPVDFSKKLGLKMFRYGIVLVPGAVVYSISFVADRLLVGWLAGPDEVAILTLAISLAAIALLLKQFSGVAIHKRSKGLPTKASSHGHRH
jgi:O-antigen/teichoic acid export membrane protein